MCRAAAARHVASVLELFSGLGGQRLAFGLARTGALPRWRAMEIDETCVGAYSEVFGSTAVQGVHGDRRWERRCGPDEVWRCSIDRLPDEAFEGSELWLMSPPCQPFMSMGRRRDLDDPRCVALLRVLEALPRLRTPPKAVLLENVPGFAGSRAHELLRGALESCGYDTEDHVLNPVDFGFPNTRTRFYCIAAAVGATGADASTTWSQAVPLPVARSGAQEPRPLREFCLPAASAHESIRKNTRVRCDLLDGGSVGEDARRFDVACGSSLATKTFMGSYGKARYGVAGLSKAGPLLLVQEDGWTPAEVERPRFAELKQEERQRLRYFAPAEMLALQGFPKGWSLPDSVPVRKQWKLIGNSINVAVVGHLLRRLLSRIGC